jgi:hypothetical protein
MFSRLIAQLIRSLFLSLFLGSSFADEGSPLQFSDQIPPIHDFLSGKDYSIAFEVTNTSSTPILISPQKDKPEAERGCRITSITKAPVLPGQKGRIELLCKWNSAERNPTFRLTSPEFQIAQGQTVKNYKATVKGMVYPAKYYVEQTDTCGIARKAKCNPAQPREKLKICFITAELMKKSDAVDGAIKGVANELFCGDSTFTQVSASNLKDIQNYLDQALENGCGILDTIAIHGHGNVGVAIVGRDQIQTQNQIHQVFGNGKYSCMLSESPRIIFGGCRLAGGCEGQVLMHSAASSLAGDKKITVIAPTADHLSVFAGATSRTGSVNGADLTLESQNGKSTWSYAGLTSSVRGDAPHIMESCLKICATHLASVTRLIRLYDSTPQCRDSFLEKKYANLVQQRKDLLTCTSIDQTSAKKLSDQEFLNAVTPALYQRSGHGAAGYFSSLSLQNQNDERLYRNACGQQHGAQVSDRVDNKLGSDQTPSTHPKGVQNQSSGVH